MNAAVGALLVAILLLWGIAVARSAPRYYDEQLLNYRYTDFCSVVKTPPKALVEALEAWLKVDKDAAMPAVIWFNRIAEKYAEAKCGDA